MKNSMVLCCVLLLIVALIPQSVSARQTCGDCEPLIQAAKDRVEKSKAKVKDILLEAIKLPDKEDLETCIRGIQLSDMFNLGVPNLQDLFNAICNEINSRIDEQLRQVQTSFKINPLPGISVSTGSGVSRTERYDQNQYEAGDIRVRNRSGELSREVLTVMDDVN